LKILVVLDSILLNLSIIAQNSSRINFLFGDKEISLNKKIQLDEDSISFSKIMVYLTMENDEEKSFKLLILLPTLL